MRVRKRDGSVEDVAFDKVVARIAHFCGDLPGLDPHAVAQRICTRIYDGVDTAKLDELGAEICSSLMTEHPDYGTLAARIIVSNHQKNTLASFLATLALLHGNASPIVSDALYEVATAHAARVEAEMHHERDFLFDYFGYKTLERSYLLRVDGRIVERPQHMWMRVALGIYGGAGAQTSEADLQRAFETYHLMSTRMYTHATPTLFNAGTPRAGLSSCFLMGVHDSIDGIYKNLGDGARISKYSGGIGLHVHNIRGQGALIRGTNGNGNGIVPMLRVYNATFRYVNQCFAGETQVHSNSGWRRMDEVRAGDFLTTGTGAAKPVLSVSVKKNDGDVYRVRTGASDAVTTVTPEHEICVRKWAVCRWSEPQYVSVAEMAETNDMADVRVGPAPGHRYQIGFPYSVPVDRAPGVDDNSMTWFDVLDLTRVPTPPGSFDVYDFNMLDEHSYVTQMGVVHNSGKRNGSAAIYLEPWHVDVFEFIALRRNTGSEEERCRDLFLALWIPDLFMERVKAGAEWSLFCPDSAPGLCDVHGEAFVALYERYEREGRARKVIKAGELWAEIVRSQVETGTPYMLYKDKCQRVNQSNLGIIRSSNLCVSPETAVLTSAGSRAICELMDQPATVWNGKEWSSVVVRQTGADQALLRVCFSDGTSLHCTAYHKFYVLEEGGQEREVRACALQRGMTVTSVRVSHPCGVPQSCTVTVTEVADEGRRDDTFCFDEPLRHRGVFNGILTGNCSEILLFSDHNEYGVCNLASLVLPSYVKDGVFDYDHLHAVAKKVVRAMDRVIDANYYSCPETERSNKRHRPVGIGIQGLADVYILLRLPFESAGAMEVNRAVMETIYHATLEASTEVARERAEALRRGDERLGWGEHLLPEQWAGAYATFEGCPASRGELQFDMWGVTPTNRFDWAALKADIQAHGLRHSMLVALMPTASTSQIMGYTESFEAITSNFMVRRTLAGEFIIVNNYLVRDLMALGLWNKGMKDRILAGNGSVQHIAEIPAHLRELYKTVWEIKQRSLIDQSAARGPFVCHTQSLNLYMEDPDLAKISNMHFYAWKQGLKTGMYYLRTRPRAKTASFTLDPALLAATKAQAESDAAAVCRRDNQEGCLMCSA
jgi:ribonucleotide reductase alpha subunit